MTQKNYSSLCDDFYLDMYINTELDLPTERDTILAFFERVQKQFPSMTCFFRRGTNDCYLEEDRNTGKYRWISLETDRIGSGFVNPSNIEEAYCQDKLVLELVPYMLSVSHLDIASLDVTFTMDFDYTGNHDEIIAEALLAHSSFSCLLDLPCAKPIDLTPAIVVALTEDSLTQARITVESRGHIKQKQGLDEAISLSFTIRQYPTTTRKFAPLKSFEHQCRLAEELMDEKIIPNIVRPLTETIAQKRFM